MTELVSKASIRSTIRAKMRPQKISPTIFPQIVDRLEAAQVRAPAAVGIYLPLDSEWNVWPIWHCLINSGYRLALPVTSGQGQMHYTQVEPQQIIQFYLNLGAEPTPQGGPNGPPKVDTLGPISFHQLQWVNGHLSSLPPHHPDFIIVPTLGLNKDMARLGYGGGYFDRFLAKYSGLGYTALVASFQTNLAFSSEDFDVRIRDPILIDDNLL